MKTKITISTIIIAVLITAIWGCAGSPTAIVVVPGYKKQFAINADLAVVIIDESPEIIYLGDLNKSLGIRNRGPESRDRDIAPETHAWNFFTNRLVGDIIKEIDVTTAFIGEIKHHYRVTRDVIRTAEEDIAIEIPEAGTRIEIDSIAPALILFLDKIRIGTETDPYYQERSQLGVHTRVGRKLIYLASFVLWDNRELKPICYGRVKTVVPINREEATTANWEDISRTFVRTMFEPTGFVKRKGK